MLVRWAKQYWPAYVSALAALFIFGFVEFYSDPFQKCIDKSYEESADKEPPERTVLRTVFLFETCTGAFFKEDGEAITAFFTLILGGATVGLWLSTKGLVESAEKTAERQLRAYVHVVDMALEHITDEYDPVLRITIKNFGQTPARSIRTILAYKAISSPKAADFESDDAKDGEHPDLAPNQDNISRLIIPRTEWDSMYPRLIAKNATFYCFGKVEYRDAFTDETRTTGFLCQMLVDDDGIGNEMSLDPVGHFGNRTT